MSLELKRITWPQQDVVVKASILILFIVVASTLFVAAIDAGVSKLILVMGS